MTEYIIKPNEAGLLPESIVRDAFEKEENYRNAVKRK